MNMFEFREPIYYSETLLVWLAFSTISILDKGASLLNVSESWGGAVSYRGVSVPLTATSQPGESGGKWWRGRTAAAANWVLWACFIFLLRHWAAHGWLWWIGMLLTHTHSHAHTCPTHSASPTTTHTYRYAHSPHARHSVRAHLMRHMWNVYDPPTRPSSSVNKLFPEVCVMHYHRDGCMWGLFPYPSSRAHPCASWCSMHTQLNTLSF